MPTPFGTPNFPNRALYQMDNLDMLRGVNSGAIDLIATDPPFNKGRDFHATPESLAAGARFDDRWRWEVDVQQQWVDQIADDWPSTHRLINAVKEQEPGMAAFMAFLGVRLIECKRVLKETGSIYVHLDPTASHYIKALMDTLFGRENFRNEIIWRKYAGRKNNATRKFSTQQETILFYAKTDAAPFNILYDPISDKEIQKKYTKKDEEGRLYREAWGRRYQLTGENRRIYLDEQPGSAIGSLWVEDGLQLNTSSAERTGYPTQKPLALYERMIKASSNEGDMVLDPFAGCATTCVAAERLGRQWVGADYWEGTAGLVIQRLQQHLPAPLQTGDWVTAITHSMTPPERTDEVEDAPMFRTPTGYKRRVGTRWTRLEMQAMIIEEFGHRCWACSFNWPDFEHYELDHVNPDTGGGSNELHNRSLLCGPCNRKKGNILTLIGLRQRRGFGRRNPHPIDLRAASAWAYQQERLHDEQANERAR